jgi:hypothetical protein
MTSDQSSNSPTFKFDCLKGFLAKFKTLFNQAKVPCNDNDPHTEEEATRTRFEQDLLANCDQISSLLMLHVYQCESHLIRALSLRLMLYLAHYRPYHLKLQSFNVNMLLVRLIDLDMSNEETALAIEYIRLLNELYAECIDKSILYCLLAAVEDSTYRIGSYLLETLLELVIKRPRLACECNVFYDLVSYIQNGCCKSEFELQLVAQCLLKVADDEACREMMKLDDLFSNLIAPMIDVDYVALTYGPFYNPHKLKFDRDGAEIASNQASESSEPRLAAAILESCSTALFSILKKTIGIPLLMVIDLKLKRIRNFILILNFYLFYKLNDGKVLKSLLSPMLWFSHCDDASTNGFNFKHKRPDISSKMFVQSDKVLPMCLN